MNFIRCGIHGFHETIGIDIDTNELRFFWAFDSVNCHLAQTAYQVLLSPKRSIFGRTSPSSSEDDESLVWDSGRVSSNQQRDVACSSAKHLASTTFYYWRVTVWDQDGVTWSSPVQEFYTSYPRCSRLLPPYSMNQTYMPHSSLIFRTWFEDEQNRWKAIWLGDGGDKPIYLRKEFRLNSAGKAIDRVVVLASGLGHFNLSLNGKPADELHQLDPGWTNYHRTVQFVGYDVTRLISGEGPNVIAAHVGNGFYAGDKGDEDRFFWPTYEDNTYVRSGNELCFFAEIHVHYAKGTHEKLISDASWSVRRSATTLANIYASEDHDRTLYPTGWNSPGFKEDEDLVPWRPALPVTGPRGKLRYQNQPPVVLWEQLTPISHQDVRLGVRIYDLGQNSTIKVNIEASGPRGTEYIVRYSESVDEHGLVCMPDPLFRQFATGVYSRIKLAGEGKEVWTPDFSFTSARYIQVEGVGVTIHSVSARHISSAARRLGYVKTDKEDVNALINACKWTFSSNLFSYHTDCPQIEKFGWLEVTHLLAPATQYTRDMETLYTKILQDIVDTQEPDGLVPTMAPLMRYMSGPLHNTITWGGALCLLPGHIKHYYGTSLVFSKIYPACVRYMEYMERHEREGGLIVHGLGDWGRDIAYGNHQANIETAIYYKCLRNVEMMARQLNRAEDEKRFCRWAERIYAIYNEKLLVASKEKYPYAHYTSLDVPDVIDRTMVAQATALSLGLVPPEHHADIIGAFVAAAEESNYTMLAGEIGLEFLWRTLAMPEVNRPDIVLAMARKEEHPSYMRFIRRGDTTLSEFWQDACRSKCHDMLGTIYRWFYEAALGVRPSEVPGEEAYRAWTLRPPLSSEFGMVEGEIDCPYGLIRVKYERTGETGARVEVRVPSGTTCTVGLPREDVRSISMKKTSDGELRKEHVGFFDLNPGEYMIKIDSYTPLSCF